MCVGVARSRSFDDTIPIRTRKLSLNRFNGFNFISRFFFFFLNSIFLPASHSRPSRPSRPMCREKEVAHCVSPARGFHLHFYYSLLFEDMIFDVSHISVQLTRASTHVHTCADISKSCYCSNVWRNKHRRQHDQWKRWSARLSFSIRNIFAPFISFDFLTMNILSRTIQWGLLMCFIIIKTSSSSPSASTLSSYASNGVRW